MAFEFVEPTNETTAAPAAEENKEVTNDVAGVDAGNTGIDVQNGADDQGNEDTGGEAVGQPSGEGDGEPDGKPKPDGSTDEEARYFFGEHEVIIEVPDDVTEALKEKGIDAMQVARELYGEGGRFELSEETKQKLYDAFGKFAVDAYLSGLKAQNETFFLREETAAKEAEAANAQRYTDIAKEVGGDEGWSRLEEWALDTLSDEELEAFNAVMQSGNQYLQQYAVRELEGRRKAAQGDDKPNLIEPTATAAASEDNAPLSREQYIREIAQLGQKYGRDRKGMAEAQARLDARRRAGMARGL
ncbi:scaffolding protein [Salmonella phage SP6]|uniref:30 n=2 Tax=Enterobacteria phage SP6 TaxID=2907955 RepID=Q6UGI7_BPSP6|nr:head scaffolding protein [Salmonella phage SP6]AAP48770.1 gp31 [Salmonella phage SP6]AAR90022.1 30 [Salmonella phage SP6]